MVDQSSKSMSTLLREAGDAYGAGGESLWYRAADKIDQLQRERDDAIARDRARDPCSGEYREYDELLAERDRLREALERIAEAPGAIGESTISKSGAIVSSYASEKIAREALGLSAGEQPK